MAVGDRGGGRRGVGGVAGLGGGGWGLPRPANLTDGREASRDHQLPLEQNPDQPEIKVSCDTLLVARG